MRFLKERRAQGAFEYILLLAGVLLIVVLAIIILRGSVLGSANNQLVSGANAASQQSNVTIAFCGPYLDGWPSTVFNGSGRAPNSSTHCWNQVALAWYPDIIR